MLPVGCLNLFVDAFDTVVGFSYIFYQLGPVAASSGEEAFKTPLRGCELLIKCVELRFSVA